MANKANNQTKRKKTKEKVIFILKIAGFAFLLTILGGFLLFIYYAKDLPRPERFIEREMVQSTKIYDRTGEVLLYELYGEERRKAVPLETMPEHLKQAVIAAEDSNFYKHFGIDLKGMARSALMNLKIMRPVYGGSTISQQLIRSTFFTLEKTAERKVREIILSLEMERRYSKDQILEWYLNQVPLGQNAYGVETASQTYFNKPVSEISLPEAAVLAALIRSPYGLSPYNENTKEELMIRKNHVLERMFQEGFLTKEEKEEAKDEEIEFTEIKIQLKAPYFTLWVVEQLKEKYGESFLREKGLKVYTSLDWELQKIAERVTREGVERNKIYNAHNAGFVSISPKTGEVLAMTVGKGDYYAEPFPEGCVSGVDCLFDPKFNVVIGTKTGVGRQPGSAFKPFVYAAAFEKGYSDQHTVVDEQTNFGVWGGKPYIPRNYDGLFRGPVTLRSALAQSLNIPSVKALVYLAGIEYSVDFAKRLGITTLKHSSSFYGPSLVLGGGEVKLLDMASAYGVFATEGLRVSPFAILKIEDSYGNIIEENKKTPRRVLEIEVARLMNDVLSDNEARSPIFGPRSNMFFENYQVAAKTGTTDNSRDGWIIGYTPSIVTGVWVGNNNNVPMTSLAAESLAGPIFHSFMREALLKFPKENFTPPKSTN